MKKMELFFFCCFLVTLLPSSTSAANVPALLVFGDSLLDAGTNIYVANSSHSALTPPYGESYFGFPTGRFCDGRTIADLLAQNLALPLAPPYLKPGAAFKYGANFASAGSRLLGPPSATKLGFVSLKSQVDQFVELVNLKKVQLGEDGARAWLNSSLLLIAIGSNDVREYLSNSSAQTSDRSRAEYVTQMLDHYKTALLRFYGEGARKIVVTGLGPLGCTPVGRFFARMLTRGTPGCLESANQLAISFNTGLRQLTRSLNRDYSNLKLLLAKPYDFLLAAINAPFPYGFTTGEVACCGVGPFRAASVCNANSFVCSDPSRFIFWDAAHFTEAANALLVSNLWRGNLLFIEPYNLNHLLSST